MRNKLSKSSPSSSHHFRPPLPSSVQTFSESIMEETIQTATKIITKWGYCEDSRYSETESLFKEHRKEAEELTAVIKDLQSAMKYLLSTKSSSQMLAQGQNLLQMAMKRLQKEFYSILKTDTVYLDPESLTTRLSRRLNKSLSISNGLSERSTAPESDFEDYCASEDDSKNIDDSGLEIERILIPAMNDLRMIANCMINSGYAVECMTVYKNVRKSMVDEGLFRFGIQRLSSATSHFHKMNWETTELKIKNWLNAVNFAVKKLFYGEKILCDHVFSSSETIRESCFYEVTSDGALALFGFPEQITKDKTYLHKSPERIFRILDLYEVIIEIFPDIESIFCFDSTSAVRSQAEASLAELVEAIPRMLTKFESAIQKENSKSLVAGGGLHPLTRYVMNYLAFLSDYSAALSDVLADWPLDSNASLPENYFDRSDDGPSGNVSVRFAWLILVLLCKLDGKAKRYPDVSLSYLFLTNNLRYVVEKVRRNSNLRYLLGDRWLAKLDDKVTQYAADYQRVGWSQVIAALPSRPAAEISLKKAKDYLVKFNAAFDDTYRKQKEWVVADLKLRDEIKLSLARKVLPMYRKLHNKCRVSLTTEREIEGFQSTVIFAPEDLENYLFQLFETETGDDGGASSSGTVTASSPSPAYSSPSHTRTGRTRSRATPSFSAGSDSLRSRDGG
ncbi:hypothetical protein Nepgr_014161 [Nepenthes gracilis]|uniref:Exocyst subunit Exo70 family protein n=1 Tax=Nepenthes gracilis TaxID=150966 RepID=A0AAD3SIP8_NEPGR|nr:hypothetical protein Nepgr_014161 [Nepenthes gracilis]